MAVPILRHYLEEQPEAEGFAIKITAIVVQRRLNTLRRSFCFSPFEFIEEDEAPGKRELLNFLKRSGTTEEFSQNLIVKVIQIACDARDSVCRDFRGFYKIRACVVLDFAEFRRQVGQLIHERRNAGAARINFKPANKLAIKSLSRTKFKKQSVGERNIKCAICLERLVAGADVANLPCGHVFHDGCVIKWLETSHLCPLCRFEFPSESEPEAKQDQRAEH